MNPYKWTRACVVSPEPLWTLPGRRGARSGPQRRGPPLADGLRPQGAGADCGTGAACRAGPPASPAAVDTETPPWGSWRALRPSPPAPSCPPCSASRTPGSRLSTATIRTEMSKHLQLQMKILIKYEEEDRFPSKIQFEDLQNFFPEDVDEESPYNDPLTYAVRSLDEMDLLDVDQHRMRIDGANPRWFRTTSIRGLRPSGETFLRRFHEATSSNVREEIMDRLKQELPSKLPDLMIGASSTLNQL